MDKHIDQLEALKEILQKFSDYHSAKSDFVKKLEKRLGGKALHRSTFNKIMDGTYKFERGVWADSIPLIYEVAHTTLRKHEIRSETEKEKQKYIIKPNEFYDFSYSVKNVEETVNSSDYLYGKGEMIGALQNIINLNKLIKIEKLHKNNPYMYAFFHLIFAKIQMQFGTTEGQLGSISLVGKSIPVFETLKGEELRLLQSINLQGHIFRQLKNYDKAIKSFYQVQSLSEILKLNGHQKKHFFMNSQHQIALTLMRKGEENQDRSYFEGAERLFVETNDFFKDSHDENWFKFSKLREAELYVKSGQLERAEKILEAYEDPCEAYLMVRTQAAVFLRINAEKYIKTKDIKNALKNFKTAVTLSLREEYNHELEQLNVLYHNYRLLKENLPDNFSVYKPIWS